MNHNLFLHTHYTMNTIEGILDKSEYEGYGDFVNFRIDGEWLDEKLDTLYPDKLYKGLIPTLGDWLESEEEKAVVWKRILPPENETSVCPILLCPDDNDFSCTLIVAEIKNSGEVIQWRKIGLDITHEWEAEKVGTQVEWFDKIQELTFSKKDYLTMLEAFKNRLSMDQTHPESQ